MGHIDTNDLYENVYKCIREISNSDFTEVFVIGGSQLYRSFIDSSKLIRKVEFRGRIVSLFYETKFKSKSVIIKAIL